MRLKPGAKVFLFLIVLFLLGFGAYKLGWLDRAIKVVAPPPAGQVDDLQPGDWGGVSQGGGDETGPADVTTPTGDQTSPSGGGKLDRPLRCGVILYGGMAGGILANNGKAPNKDCVFYKDGGIEVELVQIDDIPQMVDAFKIGGDKGGLDMMVSTVDMFALQYDQLASLKAVTVLQTDWSRGADAVAVAKGIGSVAQLKGKRISVAEGTPSHFLLLYLLTQAGLAPGDVNAVFTNSSIEAAQVFKAGKVDACVSWSPDVYIAASERPGATILASTREATNLLGGTVVARGDFVAQYPAAVLGFVKGWIKGVDMANADPENAAQVLARSYDGIRPEDATGMLMDVRLADASVNRRLFELDGDVPMGYDDLFNTANKIWKKVGLLPEMNRADVTRNTAFVADATQKQAGAGATTPEEAPTEPATPTEQKAPPIVTKTISVYFDTGSATLDDNAKQVLSQAAEFAQTFGSTYIRVSGNTDNVGGRQMNIDLSRKRAQSVVDFLIREYSFPKEKFIVKGNGPDKPVATNDTADGRAKNRRTDFEVVPQEEAQ